MVINSKSIYTPILKWKAAEMGALHDLRLSQKDNVLPLFELVPPQLSKKDEKNGITIREKLMQKSILSIPQDILFNWGDGRIFFADFTLIPLQKDLRITFAEELCKNAALLHLEFIPVINLTADNNEFGESMVGISKKYSLSQICIRVNNIELRDINEVNSIIDYFINNSGFNYSNINLLIDLKENVNTNDYRHAYNSIKQINSIASFNRLILAGGAFPIDMSQFKQDEYNQQNRDDWLGWLSHASDGIERVPIYADYTIRHPVYNENVLSYKSTATIKYTLPDKWNFYKGGVGQYEHYLANASLLCKHSDFKQFGAQFSAGDKFIDEKGQYFAGYIKQKNKNPEGKHGGTGNTTQWLRAGINHHIAVVVDQLAKLND